MSRRRKQRRELAPDSPGPRKSSRNLGAGKKSGLAWRVLGGLVAIVVLALLGGFLWVRSYLRGDEFRAELGRQIGWAAQGKAEIGELEWHGRSMSIKSVDIKSKPVGDWALRDVDAAVDLSGFWDGVWIVPEVQVRQARSEWDLRSSQARLEERGKGKASSSGKASGGGFGSSFLPQRTEVRLLRVQDYEGEVLTEGGAFSWDGVALRSEPRNQATTLVELSGGKLSLPFERVSNLKLDEGILALSEEGLEVLESEWTSPDFEFLKLSGMFTDESQALQGEFSEWKMEAFLSEDWQEKVKGQLTGVVDWRQKGRETEGVWEGEFEVEGGVLKGLPFLERLASYAGSARLRRLSFEGARAKVSQDGEVLMVRDLVLFDEGLIRLEGDLTSRSQSLSGEFEVGVPPGLLAHIPGAEEKIFLPGKGGLLWTSVKVSGTWDHLEEDLSERMIQAAGERMFELIPETGQWALRYSGQALDQGTALLLENQGLSFGEGGKIVEEGVKVVEEVLEQGGDVLEEGVGVGAEVGKGLLKGLLGQ